jgi:hypothetical protein
MQFWGRVLVIVLSTLASVIAEEIVRKNRR